MLLRPKQDADLDPLLALALRVHAQDAYPLHLPPEDVPAFFLSGDEVAGWVAEQDGTVVGHVALHRGEDYPTLLAARDATGLPADRLVLLARLFVSPDVRRTGLGRRLLHHALDRARAAGLRAVLDVGQTLLDAIALYEADGWSRAGALHLPLIADPSRTLDLWVYVSPEPPL